MKTTMIQARLRQAQILSELSSCSRRKVGALILHPNTLSIVSDGYNGPPRKGPSLCGGDHCLRDHAGVKSGSHNDIGCYHAEQNAILNAARSGVPTLNMIMICTTFPCVSCARSIYHAGISSLYVEDQSYPDSQGLLFLQEFGVLVFKIKPTQVLS